MESYSVEEAAHYYRIDCWGVPYYFIHDDGEVRVRPHGIAGSSASLIDILSELRKEDIHFPCIIRFPQILEHRLHELHSSFERSASEFDFNGRVQGVFPVKVNQRRTVISHLSEYGKGYSYGLEVGSKAELALALSMELAPESIVICNGYKDRAYVDMALAATSIGINVFLIAEKSNEIPNLIKFAKDRGIMPNIGIRLKLTAKPGGHWEHSGGEFGKFGLSTSDVLLAFKLLEEADMIHCAKMLHFHVGSQIPHIKRFKAAIREASRIYAKLRKRYESIEYLDIGGGMGIDYIGNRQAVESSVNYTLREYTNDVLYTIGDICEEEDIPEPNVVFENGRAVAAHHSVIVTRVLPFTQIHTEFDLAPKKGEIRVLHDLFEDLERMKPENFMEVLHDAQDYRALLNNAFDLGKLSLDERARGERIFLAISKKAIEIAKSMGEMDEELQTIEKNLADKFVCNFSLFQSLPDMWAFDQLFPICPLNRLNERPTIPATLSDITCDSDGMVDKFIAGDDICDSLFLHVPDERAYYIGAFLTGAYQDVLGDFHNLFGACDEVNVYIHERGEIEVGEVEKGDSLLDVLTIFESSETELTRGFIKKAEEAHSAGKIDKTALEGVKQYFNWYLGQYTYLDL
ncbi:MAG: biosynthetic arginine decarboxylase [Planctomycetes bacterium]|nr:biosynthetic arginine decarboxylase [Planctomycetota bacterium]